MATIARRGVSAATKADESLRQHGFDLPPPSGPIGLLVH